MLEGTSRSKRDIGAINREQSGQQEAVTAVSLVQEADKSALQRKSKRGSSVLQPLSPEHPTPIQQPKLPEALSCRKLKQENKHLQDENTMLKKANAAL